MRAAILHLFAVWSFAFAIAARTRQRRIILFGLRRRDAGIVAVLFCGALQKDSENEFYHYEHAAHNRLNLDRHLAVTAKLLKISFEFFINFLSFD